MSAAETATPSSAALDRVVTVVAVALRASCTIAGGVAAFAATGPPVRPAVLAAAVGAFVVWSAAFARLAFRARLRHPLILTDLALTGAACLFIGSLVPPEALPGECSWVAVVASTSVVLAQLLWPAGASIPAGLAIAAAYLVGATAAGDPTEASNHAFTLIVQTLSVAVLMVLVRRAARGADVALGEYRGARREALVERARRAEERRHNRDLHDTVLSTLTMVGLGAVPSDSGPLRERAAGDLLTIERALHDLPSVRTGALADRLATLPARFPWVSVRLGLCDAGARLPAPVTDGLVESAAEALSNVERHAGVRVAELHLTGSPNRVHVRVVDSGRGFTPAAVPATRFGLRESVHARMAEIGGRAEVVSAPDAGTQVHLRWPA